MILADLVHSTRASTSWCAIGRCWALECGGRERRARLGAEGDGVRPAARSALGLSLAFWELSQRVMRAPCSLSSYWMLMISEVYLVRYPDKRARYLLACCRHEMGELLRTVTGQSDSTSTVTLQSISTRSLSIIHGNYSRAAYNQ